jgi:hypothetical protein
MLNFSSFLWKDKNIKITFKPLVKKRASNKVKFGKAILEIESPLSFIINNMKKLENDKKFKEYLNTVHFMDDDIVSWLLLGYKLSWLSRLAIYMKNIWKRWQYLTIKNVIESAWKKIDRRWNKIKIIINNKIVKPKNNKVSFDELI